MSWLDEIGRDGAHQLLAEALKAAVARVREQYVGQLDERGRQLVVRSGYHPSRDVLTAAKSVKVTATRVNDTRIDPGSGERSSSFLRRFCRRERKSRRWPSLSP